MTIRTTSDLKEVDILRDADLFRVSTPAYDGYASSKVKYSTVRDGITAHTKTQLQSDWKLEGFNGKAVTNQLSGINDALTIIPENDSRSRVDFKLPPTSSSASKNPIDIPNRRDVITMITDNSQFISPNVYVEIDPMNSAGSTQYSNDPRQYHWHLDSGTTDSSQAQDIVSNLGPHRGVVISDSGFLTIYGWLASNASVQAQEAWVGLFAWIKTGTYPDAGNWVLIQVQPWIVGQYAQAAQYVGFNAFVKRGLELKIMTGFPVNGNSSGLHVGNTLMFNTTGNMPNSFVGYVIVNS